MSEDETLVFLIGSVFGGVLWLRWYWQLMAIARLRARTEPRLILGMVPVLCAAILWLVLRYLAAHDVRDVPIYLGFYLVLGAAWVAAAMQAMSLLGLSARDDALERHNPAATWAVAGGLVGLTACFAGANIGDGPGWWVVVYAACLSTLAWFVLWGCLEWLTRLSESVTVDRDAASGLRLGGFLVGEGLILGRAAAGDWASLTATNDEFLRMAWPAAALLAMAVVLNQACRPGSDRPRADWLVCGAVPAVVFLAMAVTWLWIVGLGV